VEVAEVGVGLGVDVEGISVTSGVKITFFK
jgi:hypothetical protein